MRWPTALRARGSRRLLVGRLATDYCVKATVLDAVASGFDVAVLEDAIRAVDVHAGDGAKAVEAMAAAGAIHFPRASLTPARWAADRRFARFPGTRWTCHRARRRSRSVPPGGGYSSSARPGNMRVERRVTEK